MMSLETSRRVWQARQDSGGRRPPSASTATSRTAGASSTPSRSCSTSAGQVQPSRVSCGGRRSRRRNWRWTPRLHRLRHGPGSAAGLRSVPGSGAQQRHLFVPRVRSPGGSLPVCEATIDTALIELLEPVWCTGCTASVCRQVRQRGDGTGPGSGSAPGTRSTTPGATGQLPRTAFLADYFVNRPSAASCAACSTAARRSMH